MPKQMPTRDADKGAVEEIPCVVEKQEKEEKKGDKPTTSTAANKYVSMAKRQRQRKQRVQVGDGGAGEDIEKMSVRKRKRTAKLEASKRVKRQKNLTEENATYGNYKKYYRRRGNGEDDARVQLLRHQWMTSPNASLLDIGCNAGELTMQVARRYKDSKILGVDIDADLIKRAQQRQRDVAQAIITTSTTTSGYPHNVSFVTEDVCNDNAYQGVLDKKYDVVMAMSVTKWIHMTTGDEGLKLFFARVKNALRPGGVFVLEPQLSKSYKNARRRGAVEKHLTMDSFQLKPELFAEYLVGEGGFVRMETLRKILPKNTPFGNRPVMAFFTSTEMPQAKQMASKQMSLLTAKPTELPLPRRHEHDLRDKLT